MKIKKFFHLSPCDIQGRISTFTNNKEENAFSTLDLHSVKVAPGTSGPYLRQAEALVDVLGDVDHVSVFGQHHEEAVQSLQVGAVELQVQVCFFPRKWLIWRPESERTRRKEASEVEAHETEGHTHTHNSAAIRFLFGPQHTEMFSCFLVVCLTGERSISSQQTKHPQHPTECERSTTDCCSTGTILSYFTWTRSSLVFNMLGCINHLFDGLTIH